ncbi:MAG: DUF3846 domain-containing protein [Oscillospiraceae bacterium]
MKILVCEAGKHPVVKEINHTLKNLQEVVGGYIQAIYPFEEMVTLVCNEDGIALNLPRNRMVKNYGIIRGTFFICGLTEEDFCSLTDAQIEHYKKLFWNIEYFIPTPDGILPIIIKD